MLCHEPQILYTTIRFTLLATIGSLACVADAAGDTWPQTIGEMVHVEVSLDDSVISIAPVHDGNLELHYFAESYTPPADVLDGKGYNDQYGWTTSGFWDLPPDALVWIEVLAHTPGLQTYEGGRRMHKDTHTYAPILATADSPTIWQWDGMMWHHWYAASDLGDYEAAYRVYIGDAQGEPLPGFTPGQVTLSWQYIPAPSSAVLTGLAGLVGLRRRRAHLCTRQLPSQGDGSCIH